MKINSDNSLVSYELTELQAAAGQQLNMFQAAIIQNERVAITQEIVSLTADSMKAEDKDSYWQRKAYLRGQLDILTTLLQRSATAVAASESSESN